MWGMVVKVWVGSSQPISTQGGGESHHLTY